LTATNAGVPVFMDVVLSVTLTAYGLVTLTNVINDNVLTC